MFKQNNREFLYLVWQDPVRRMYFTVGMLSKNGNFMFEYGQQLAEARQSGFTPLVSFPDFGQVYESSEMFSVFSCRLPDAKRRGIENILKKYGLEAYDEFDFLKKTGARLPTDTLSFIDPIFEEEEIVNRSFFVNGARYCMGCQGDDCNRAATLLVGDRLCLQLDSENPHDKNAILICTQDGATVGYIPHYYSESVTKRLKLQMSYTCTVISFEPERTCSECIKVKLDMPALSMGQL